MSSLRPRTATEADVPVLLRMMEPFNALENTPWNARKKESALRTLLADRALGVAVMVESSEAPMGYFVLTWGYDLGWNGRDAVLTEMYLVPEARGLGHGSAALEAAEV